MGWYNLKVYNYASISCNTLGSVLICCCPAAPFSMIVFCLLAVYLSIYIISMIIFNTIFQYNRFIVVSVTCVTSRISPKGGINWVGFNESLLHGKLWKCTADISSVRVCCTLRQLQQCLLKKSTFLC